MDLTVVALKARMRAKRLHLEKRLPRTWTDRDEAVTEVESWSQMIGAPQCSDEPETAVEIHPLQMSEDRVHLESATDVEIWRPQVFGADDVHPEETVTEVTLPRRQMPKRAQNGRRPLPPPLPRPAASPPVVRSPAKVCTPNRELHLVETWKFRTEDIIGRHGDTDLPAEKEPYEEQRDTWLPSDLEPVDWIGLSEAEARRALWQRVLVIGVSCLAVLVLAAALCLVVAYG